MSSARADRGIERTPRRCAPSREQHGVVWWTVHRILVATAVQVLGQAAPTPMIGYGFVSFPATQLDVGTVAGGISCVWKSVAD